MKLVTGQENHSNQKYTRKRRRRGRRRRRRKWKRWKRKKRSTGKGDNKHYTSKHYLMNFCEWTKKKKNLFFCSLFFVLLLLSSFSPIHLNLQHFLIFFWALFFFYFFFRKSEEEQKINDDSNNLLNSIKSQNTGVDHFSTEQASMPQHQHQERFFETVGHVLFFVFAETRECRDPRLL